MTWITCPKCSGQGIVSKPDYIAGDVHQWSSNSVYHTCNLCNGTMIISEISGLPPDVKKFEGVLITEEIFNICKYIIDNQIKIDSFPFLAANRIQKGDCSLSEQMLDKMNEPTIQELKNSMREEWFKNNPDIKSVMTTTENNTPCITLTPNTTTTINKDIPFTYINLSNIK